MIQMNLLTKQKETHELTKYTYGGRGRVGAAGDAGRDS